MWICLDFLYKYVIHVIICFGENKVWVSMFEGFLMKKCITCTNTFWREKLCVHFLLKKCYPCASTFWQNKDMCEQLNMFEDFLLKKNGIYGLMCIPKLGHGKLNLFFHNIDMFLKCLKPRHLKIQINWNYQIQVQIQSNLKSKSKSKSIWIIESKSKSKMSLNPNSNPSPFELFNPSPNPNPRCL